MAHPNKVYPAGSASAEAKEHEDVINGAWLFGAIAVIAHVLASVYSPWLH